ncbi:hypothetical protein [Mycobacterium branderi]|uniref:Uncharacterized protein n=1 Tax=Mycobacterium branderi TaxID=43348 RepID=A0A7I7WC64_9MYCO|nr:hypothetical protein [Mycobacterium branderi]MCV7236196.1 hypothetical protein [Mycobacterium branderi]ORA35385.1 hypothetical protein BST20_17420 [Mycobacterium branderi]BBZ15074.1 hypothetical protein MBRA_52690 [Mycobacterium branderi]
MTNLKQQDVPAEDLSDLGAPAPRGAGLAGLLSGPPPATERTDAPAANRVPVNSMETAPPPAPPESARAEESAPRRGRKPGRPRTRMRPTSAVYVSPGVKQRFEAYRHKQKATNLQVVLEAISSKHDQLAEIIRDATFNTAPVNPLFPADPAAVRYVGGGSVQIGFSPTPEQEEVIDRIGRELGFDTRSTWIAPVLNAFLPGRKDSHPQRP